MSPSITSDFAREEDIDRILEINKLEYGSHDILATHSDFAWRHDQNPAGKAIIPVIRNHDNQVIGFIWIVPIRIRIRGNDYLSAMGSNLVIHPDYRKSIGYTKLLRCFQRVFKEKNIPLHFSFISEETYRRQLIQNPQSVATIPVLAKVFDLKTVAGSYLKDNHMKWILNLGNIIASPILFSKKESTVNDFIVVKKQKTFSPNFNDFWQEVRDHYPSSIIRDQAFLSWRFASISGRHYDIFVAEIQGRLLGYMVLRCATIRRIKVGIVSDFMIASDNLGRDAGICLLNEAETWFRSCNMSLSIALMTRSSDEYRMLRHAGYLRLPKIISPKTFRFGIYIHSDQIKILSSLSAQEWFVTVADYEST